MIKELVQSGQSKEMPCGNPIRVNGATYNQEDLRESIQLILKSECRVDTNNVNQPLEELLWQISLAAFRRSHLLSTLVTYFSGDIKLAMRFAYPEHFKKPLLDLAHIRPWDHSQEIWLARTREIELKIMSTMTALQPIVHRFLKERRVGRKGGHMIKVQANEHSFEKINAELWWERENRGLSKVISQFVNPGHTVCSFMSGHDPVIPAMALRHIGPSGKLYIASPDHYLANGLFNRFWKMSVDISSKDDKTGIQTRKEKYESRISGSKFIDKEFNGLIRAFLGQYVFSEDFYLRGHLGKDGHVMARFFEAFNIVPLQAPLPQLLKEIPWRSVDVLIERDRFSEIDEDQKEEILYQIDRVLKPGGYLIFRESAREQTAIEYYGEELFDGKYESILPAWLRSGQIVIRRKAPTTKQRVEKRRLTPEEFLIGQAKDSRLNPQKNCHRRDRPIPATNQLAQDSETRSSQKLFYTVEDIAKELSVGAGVIKRLLHTQGIKGIRANKSSQGRKSGVQLRFSYPEYVTLRDTLRDFITKNKIRVIRKEKTKCRILNGSQVRNLRKQEGR